MLDEELLTKKKVGCVDLVNLVFVLEEQGVKYKINDDGSLTVYNPDFAFIYESGSNKWFGRLYDALVQGAFTISSGYGKAIFECNQYSTRTSLNY
jgi:hypothetical protein